MSPQSKLEEKAELDGMRKWDKCEWKEDFQKISHNLSGAEQLGKNISFP